MSFTRAGGRLAVIVLAVALLGLTCARAFCAVGPCYLGNEVFDITDFVAGNNVDWWFSPWDSLYPDMPIQSATLTIEAIDVTTTVNVEYNDGTAWHTLGCLEQGLASETVFTLPTTTQVSHYEYKMDVPLGVPGGAVLGWAELAIQHIDTVPPNIALTQYASEIGPPNKKMVLCAFVKVMDNSYLACSTDITVTGSEDVTGDYQVLPDTTTPGWDIWLRSQADSHHQPREYYIDVVATDPYGNQSTASATVTVSTKGPKGSKGHKGHNNQ